MKYREEVEALRVCIAALHADRTALQAQQRNRAAVGATVAALVDRWHAAGVDALGREIQRAAAGGPPDLMSVHGAVIIPKAPGVSPLSLDLGPLLTALLGPKAITRALAGLLDQVPEGLDATARADRLTTIERELDRLEAEEERAIEMSELDGDPIERRPDARPEIILVLPDAA